MCLALAGPAAIGADGGPGAVPRYSFEIWYDLRPELTAQFDDYFHQLERAETRTGHAVERWVEASFQGSRRIVTRPAESLGAFGSDRSPETVLRTVLGDQGFHALVRRYDDAQFSRASFIRHYRDDLSLRRERHARSGHWGTAYTLVAVASGREREFERLWRRAIASHARVAPDLVLAVSETIAGGGPRYLVAQPLRASDDPGRLAYDGVAAALPPRDAASFARNFRGVVVSWETVLYEAARIKGAPVEIDAVEVDATLRP